MLEPVPRTLKSNAFPDLLLRTAALIGAVMAGCADGVGTELSCVNDPKIAVKRCGDAHADGSVESDSGTRDGSVEPDARTDSDKPDSSPARDAGTDSGKPDGSIAPDAGTDSGVPNAGNPASSVSSTGAVVTRVTADGSGCPGDGTATATIAPDGKSFTVTFTEFSGSIDENGRSDSKSCDLAITVSAPDKQTYGLQSINLKGTGKIGAGATVDVSSYYYIQGDSAVRAEQQTTLTGPYDQAFDLSHAYGDDGPTPPCGVARNINVSLRFNLRNGTPPSASTFTMKSVGDAVFRLVPCP